MSIFIIENLWKVLGFANPVVDSDNVDDDIFKLERQFSDVFKPIVN